MKYKKRRIQDLLINRADVPNIYSFIASLYKVCNKKYHDKVNF